jgi:hypothetical protein
MEEGKEQRKIISKKQINGKEAEGIEWRNEGQLI